MAKGKIPWSRLYSWLSLFQLGTETLRDYVLPTNNQWKSCYSLLSACQVPGSVRELWVSPSPSLLRHVGLLMSICPICPFPSSQYIQSQPGTTYGAGCSRQRDILCTKSWSVKMQSLFRESGWNFGYEEQKTQVLKLSFLPLLSLFRGEEAKCDQEATE